MGLLPYSAIIHINPATCCHQLHWTTLQDLLVACFLSTTYTSATERSSSVHHTTSQQPKSPMCNKSEMCLATLAHPQLHRKTNAAAHKITAPGFSPPVSALTSSLFLKLCKQIKQHDSKTLATLCTHLHEEVPVPRSCVTKQHIQLITTDML
jgi:hypothetical protein